MGERATRTSRLAIVSLVCGISALLIPLLGILTGVLAIIFGICALKVISRCKSYLNGKGLAIAGIILGATFVILALLGVMAVIFLPHESAYKRARANAPVNECIANLEQIEGAKMVWAIDNKAPGNAIPAWEDLTPKYMKKKWKCPLGGTYTIGRTDEPPTCSIGDNNTARTDDDHILKE